MEMVGSQAPQPDNPKDMIGARKLPIGLVPDTLVAFAATAFAEGALKYGRFNWRVAGVRASIYNDAMERHRMRWWNGEDADPATRVKHLASIIACAGILLDAELNGMLTDDRPPAVEMGPQLDALAATVAHLREAFKDHAPRQWTIADRPPQGLRCDGATLTSASIPTPAPTPDQEARHA